MMFNTLENCLFLEERIGDHLILWRSMYIISFELKIIYYILVFLTFYNSIVTIIYNNDNNKIIIMHILFLKPKEEIL